MAIYIENKLVVTRTTEYGVEYNSSGVDGEPVVTPMDNIHTATKSAKTLNGHVVQHMVFVSEWEPCFDDSSTA